MTNAKISVNGTHANASQKVAAGNHVFRNAFLAGALAIGLSGCPATPVNTSPAQGKPAATAQEKMSAEAKPQEKKEGEKIAIVDGLPSMSAIRAQVEKEQESYISELKQLNSYDSTSVNETINSMVDNRFWEQVAKQPPILPALIKKGRTAQEANDYVASLHGILATGNVGSTILQVVTGGEDNCPLFNDPLYVKYGNRNLSLMEAFEVGKKLIYGKYPQWDESGKAGFTVMGTGMGNTSYRIVFMVDQIDLVCKLYNVASPITPQERAVYNEARGFVTQINLTRQSDGKTSKVDLGTHAHFVDAFVADWSAGGDRQQLYGPAQIPQIGITGKY
jgi:hypothetical protein